MYVAEKRRKSRGESIARREGHGGGEGKDARKLSPFVIFRVESKGKPVEKNLKKRARSRKRCKKNENGERARKMAEGARDAGGDRKRRKP